MRARPGFSSPSLGPLRTPLPHQSDTLQWAHQKDRIALFLEMRLGKTLVAIRWAQSFKPRRVLIVCPLTVLPTWLKELRLEGIEGVSARDGFVDPYEYGESDDNPLWLVANYDMLRSRNSSVFTDVNWDVVVADESTVIRNPKAAITRMFLRKVCANAKAILSGLPAPESPMDYWSQMAWLGDGTWMRENNFWSWRNKYFCTDTRGWKWVPKLGTRKLIREQLSEDAYVLTRKSANVGPGKVYETRHIAFAAEQQRIYKAVKKDFATDEVETKWAIVRLGWLHRLAGGFAPSPVSMISDGKVREVARIVLEELPTERIVIWCKYTAEIATIVRALNVQAGRVVARRIFGSTPVEVRGELIEKFQRGSLRVLVCQVKCARFGIDLSAGDTAIYYSNAFDCEHRVQSEDRIVSPLKKSPCLYIDLVTTGSVDEDISDLLREKKLTSKAMLMRVLMERMGWR